MMRQSKWIPGTEVTRHAGSPIPEGMDFFVAPPPDIGQVVSAESTLTVSKHPMPPERRLMVSFLVGVPVAVMVLLIMSFTIEAMVVAVIPAAIAGSLIYFFTRFSHQCSYVGEQGMVEFKISGSRSAEPKANLLRFKEAENLYTSQTRHYYNGVYTSTFYEYKWTRGSGRDYRLTGSYRSEKGQPKDKDKWHFASSAEAIWSGYKLQAISNQLDKLGYAEFPMQGNPQAVRVGSGFLEFVLKDGTAQRVDVNDMRDIKLGSGLFQFAHHDARWWSGRGKYAFTYGKLPNARLFLLCLDKLAGIRWS